MTPLDGLLVADFSRVLAGPLATMTLADLGATVVKVERPDAGDETRTWGPPWTASSSAYFECVNRGKLGVTLDLTDETDRAHAHELARRADVVVHNLRGMRRYGLDYDSVAARNPRVVYCSITGFGAGGRRAGHDLNYMGWAGLLADTAPALPPVQAADLAGGGLFAVTEILSALLERGRTGRGRRIVVSMTHNAHRLGGHRLGSDERILTGGLASYRIYATADGRFLTLAALEPKFWTRLCEALERRDLARRQLDVDQEALAGELAAIFRTRPLATWLDLFEREDVPAGPVATLEEAAERFGEPSPSLPPPRLGEHTAAWRTELGLR
jgi:alpha-methylacyl-CoA racemase